MLVLLLELSLANEVKSRSVSSAVHTVDVEWYGVLPRCVGRKGVFLGLDVVAIGTTAGRKAGVHIVGNGPQAQRCDVRRQHLVEFVDHLVEVGQRLCRVEMGYIVGSVYPRVGAPGTHHLDLLTQEHRESLLEGLLYRGLSVLALPTAVGTPVVAQFEKVSHDGSCFFRATKVIINWLNALVKGRDFCFLGLSLR